MRRAVICTVAAICVILLTTNTSAQSIWVPVAAHSPGVHDSVWRTDVTVLNPCLDQATVTLVLHTEAGELSESYQISGGHQQLFEDVVEVLGGGDLNAALEVEASREVTVTSRTYNLTEAGRFGQGLVGITEAQGLATGSSVLLQHLREDETFRSNLLVLNMGEEDAAVEIALSDGLGTDMGSYRLDVPAGMTVLDSRPFANRYQREDVLAGFARVTVVDGAAVYPFASVVDGSLGDPTTIVPITAPDCPVDIADRLAAIEGLTVVESSTSLPGYRYFVLHYWQPADHNDPQGPGFSQYLTLLHHSEDAPMVLHTAGYYNNVRDFTLELTAMLGANQLSVEHRFFADSTPSPVDWSLLTIEQAADDHHRVVQAFKPIYSGVWVNTGASKGGMTAMYHRRFHPDDVDATVPYVAPISFAAPDERYVDFVATRGTEQCRADLEAMQVEVLERRDTMLSMYQSWASGYNHSFDRIGGIEQAFEAAVVELPFTFWQYTGQSYCPLIPGSDATDAVLFNLLASFSSLWYPTDHAMNYYASYFYQAHTQLGYPDLGSDHLEDLLLFDVINLEEGLPPAGVSPTYDEGAAMLDVAEWVTTEGSTLLFIYGENDPWSAAVFELGAADDSYLFTVAGGTHSASISRLSSSDQQQVEEILERWTGVSPSKASEVQAPPPPAGRPMTEPLSPE